MSARTPVFDDDIDRREQAARDLEAFRERYRASVRKHLPTVTALADDLRATFGDGVRIEWGIEGDVVVGRPPREVMQEHAAKHGLDRLRPLRPPQTPQR